MPMKTRASKPRKNVEQETHSLMRGRVVDNEDPLKIGRVKVYIPFIHGDTKESELPWAFPCFFNASYDSGTFILPEVGNTVWLLFEDNRLDKPVYLGGMYGTGTWEKKKIGNTSGLKRNQTLGQLEVPDQNSDPNRKVVYKSPKGASVEIDETPGNESVHIKDFYGNEFGMSSPIKESDIPNWHKYEEQKNTLKDKARQFIRNFLGSLVSMETDGEETEISVKANGSKSAMIIVSSGEIPKVLLTTDTGKQVAVEVSNKVRVLTGDSVVTVDDEEIRIKSEKVVIESGYICVGEED